MSAAHAAGTTGGLPEPIRFLTEAGNSQLLWLCWATASTADLHAASSFDEWLKRHAEIRPRPLGTPEHDLAMSTWHADIRSARAALVDDAARTVAIAITDQRVGDLHFMMLISTAGQTDAPGALYGRLGGHPLIYVSRFPHARELRTTPRPERRGGLRPLGVVVQRHQEPTAVPQLNCTRMIKR